MSKRAGYGGNVDIDGTDYDVTSWSADIVCDELDGTDTGDGGNRTFGAGLKSGTGTCSMVYDDDVAPLTVGSSVTLKLELVKDTKYYSGTAIVTGVHPANTVEGWNTITFDFRFTGAISFT